MLLINGIDICPCALTEHHAMKDIGEWGVKV